MGGSVHLSYHPAKFGGHRDCGSKDIMVLLCLVLSQDHAIKASCDFMDRNFGKP